MNDWNLPESPFDEAAFCGEARLFPLPNLVLFPHVVQPLHVFEDRYREMVEDALVTDRLISMAVLEPGWEPEYECRPPVAPYACLGKIVTHHRLKDGRYNLLLLGVRRVRIARELDPVRSFRQAKVELLHDSYVDDSATDPDSLKRALLDAFQQRLPVACQSPEQFGSLFAKHVPLGIVTDLVAYTLPLELAIKQKLLAECHVEIRAQMLLEQLGALSGVLSADQTNGGFPPPFSAN
jgi:ATP-dependent Lon protease